MGATTDVANGVQVGTGKALRGGGFNKAAIGAGSATRVLGSADLVTGERSSSNQMIPTLMAPEATTSQHVVDGTTSVTAWGNGATGSGLGASVTLQCSSCHDPHGNGNYRILRPIPAAGGLSNPVAGVRIPDAAVKVYTTTNYWLSGDANVAADPAAVYTAELPGASGGLGGTPPDGYIANVANWCSTCHTRYLATARSSKVASGDSTFSYQHRSDVNIEAGGANCITCHVSHGSNAVMSGDSAVAEPGAVVSSANSRLLRVGGGGICVMCHNV
ncbi:hypothetical protein [Tessaracoccus sp.]